MKIKKKFISEVDLNKSSHACLPCREETKKISERINKRKLKEIKSEEVPQLLKVFNF